MDELFIIHRKQNGNQMSDLLGIPSTNGLQIGLAISILVLVNVLRKINFKWDESY